MTQFEEEVIEASESSMALGETSMWSWVLHLLNALVIMAITFVVVKITTHGFSKLKNKNELHIKFIKNLVIGLEYVLGITLAAYCFTGMQKVANTVLAGSGILAVVLGLAAQQSFSNIFSGIFICIFKPFNIGDKISIMGDSESGFVEDITLRHTIIRTYTNVRLIIPNSIIGSAKIENMTYAEGASYPIEITIAFEDKEKRYRALEIMEEVVKSHPLFYKPKEDCVKALCVGYGDSGINLKILMWTADINSNMTACSDCRLQILDRFEQEGIEVPYNKVQLLK